MNPPTLCYVEDCLPGATRAERLERARSSGLALEVADREGLELGEFTRLGLRIETLQAYGMHELHPLHPDPEQAARAPDYLRGVIEDAARAGIPRVLAACGFGSCLRDRALERCLDFFSEFVVCARDKGVRLMIEPLSPLRADAMTDPAEIAELLRNLAASDVFSAALDTGHLIDGGHDVGEVLRAWREPLEELQLRGPRGAPPALDIPLRRWLDACVNRPSILSVEHRQPIDERHFGALIAHCRTETDE